MSLYINEQQPQDDNLDYDFRVLVLEQKNDSNSDGTVDVDVEQSEMKGKLLEGIRTFSGINRFFDEFDTKIAYPNEESIKYDVGSDGFIVILVKSAALKAKVVEFIDDYLKSLPSSSPKEVQRPEDDPSDADNDTRTVKKAKK
ncbi:DEKNAAC103977 [Brettanomyces naardenensis]|uniref:DEKNAAC103977 n=1 Tax=Brettanomyces naardenensis TaxID=13370 RepID=A0A448YPR3_BRENA|nr:DEKNAAC103977 [Brettanomyces naardenensis]